MQTASSVGQQTGSGFWSGLSVRDSSVFAYCLTLIELVLAIGHTGACSVKPLPVCCRHDEKHLAVTSSMLNSRKFFKTPTDEPGTALKHHYLFCAATLTNGQKRLDQYHSAL